MTNEIPTWELSLTRSDSPEYCITNGVTTFDPNMWGDILLALNALEAKLKTAEDALREIKNIGGGNFGHIAQARSIAVTALNAIDPQQAEGAGE